MDVEIRCKEFNVHGQCHDLARAYRQQGVRPDDLHLSTSILPYNGQARFITLFALCFGLSSAVLGFNRIGGIIKWFLRSVMLLTVDAYFDDFIQLESKECSYVARDILKKAIRILGFIIDPKKSSGPGREFRWLGSMKLIKELSICTYMDRRRIGHIVAMINEAITANELKPHDAGTLRGKWGFACLGTWGATGRIANEALKKREHTAEKNDFKLTPALVEAFRWMKALLAVLPPAEHFLAGSVRKHFILYTDASSEESRKTARNSFMRQYFKNRGIANANILEGSTSRHVQLGWVFYEEGSTDHFASGWHVVGDELLLKWNKKQPIACAECLAATAACILCLDKVYDADVTLYCDNQPSVGGFIKGSSKEENMDSLIHGLQLFLCARRSRLWVEYVPSKLNISDEPSRCGEIGGKKCEEQPLPEILTNGEFKESALELLIPQAYNGPRSFPRYFSKL